MRAVLIRAEVQRLLRAVPFKRFSLNMENGDRLVVEHPWRMTFRRDSSQQAGSPEFVVLTVGLRVYALFESVNNIAHLDRNRLGVVPPLADGNGQV